MALRLALALLSAVLMALAFPRFDLVLFAPFSITPLLLAVSREPRPGRRFLLGWAAGIVYWCIVCYWIQGVLEHYGGLGQFGSWATFALFCVLKAVHLGVFSMLAAVVLETWYAIPAVAALWVGIERTHGAFGFAWLALGNAGIDMALPARMAPYLGVYGLSFLFALMGAAAAIVILRRGRRQMLWLAPVLALFLFPALPAPEEPERSAVIVQPNVNEDQTWTPESAARFVDRLIALSLEGSKGARAHFIIWPETPGPIYYYRDAAFQAKITELARSTASYVLFGTVAETPRGEPLNSAALLRPDGALVDRYDKINLVPFGEFVPSVFGWVNRITQEAGDFVPGARVVTMPVGDRRIGTFICYESVFPSEVRQFVKNGATLLVNISNDGYFGHTAAHEQHLKIARMRAVENRRWLLRATNDGISASIDPAGRVRQTLPAYSEAAGQFGYSYESGVTPYTRYGDWFAWSCLLAGAAALFFSQWPHYTPRARRA